MIRCIANLLSLALLVASSAVAQEIHEVMPLDLGANTEDYAPVVLDSGIVFCSIRETSAAIAFKDAETGKPLADLYWLPFKGDGFGQPVLLSANITTAVNEGPSSFSDQGRTVFFTRNQVLPKKLSNLRASNAQLGIFISTLDQGSWSAPVPFQHNSVKFSVMHPAISKDGNTLVFASDMGEGQGTTGGVLMKNKKMLNSLLINGVLAVICLCWTVPTIGLLISSFRDRIDINRTGWWTIFPHKDWVSVEKLKPGPEVDRNQPMTVEGITATFEEFSQGIETKDLRLKWVGNRRVGYLDVQRYGWTAASNFSLENYKQVLAGDD